MLAERPPFTRLVVIGASAGGIKALSALVGALPADLVAPIVIAQHLDPARVSHLQEILARQCLMPVRTVVERERLEPGVVYVVAANQHVEVIGHELHLIADHGGPHPSVDLLLTSAARVFGEGLIAVILTGHGSDGAAGAQAVKAAGGIVLIQDPATAPYPSMPLSLAPTVVDIAAPPERLGNLLPALLADSDRAAALQDGPGLRAFLEQVRSQQGIDFGSYRAPTILRRLQRRLVATGTNSLTDYLAYLNDHPEEYQRLVHTFLIKVTEFFRDAQLFDYFRSQLLPELLATAQREGRGLRCWSAGCATGEEPYSLAILLAELLGDALEQSGIRIFATDLDEEAIAFARRGVYPASALSAVAPELVTRYFTHQDGEYAVKKRVRSMIVFGLQNLAQRAPFPNIDLVLCRNVLIYFTPELQRRTLQLFAFSLRDDGRLALGKAETAAPLAEYFRVEHPQLKVYRRQGGHILFPPSQFRATQPPPLSALNGTAAYGRRPSAGPRPASEPRRGEPLDNLAAELAVGVVLVDRQYDIKAINPAARRYFGIYGEAFGDDFLHLVHTVAPALLRPLLDAALRGETPAPLEEVPAVGGNGNEISYLRVQCAPYRTGIADVPEAVLLQAFDVSRPVGERRAVEEVLRQALTERAEAGGEAAHREGELRTRLAEAEARTQELTGTVQQLREANQSLVAGNIELRRVSEEYLISNEESQAATEEVETLYEEVQASNEELETLNEEMQSTMEELHATNDDLAARSEELQLLAARAESERARLQAILAGLGDAVLVVDAAGNVVLANSAYIRLLGDPELGIQAENAEGQRLPPEQTPDRRAAAGESFTMEFAVRQPDGSRRWFEAVGEAISADSDQQGVVVIRDVTERSLRRLQDEFLALASHELLTPLTVIKGNLQLILRSRESLSDRAVEYARSAAEQVQQVQTISRDLLDVARLQRGQLPVTLAPVDLRALTGRVVDLARDLAQGQEISLDVPGGPVVVRGDAGRLQQVLLNLLTNAIRYAPAPAKITVSLGVAGTEALLAVQDNGPGIPAGQLPALFTRFYQASPADRRGQHGLGLGLYLARQIVTAHGGTIDVASTVGEGTTFTVCLPIPAEETDAAERPAG
jgi:two-component system, chemotaxis family, CheB/CheR fusion protein